jgi:ferric-dicitrate binding protein FerR (iron transport regulator)
MAVAKVAAMILLPLVLGVFIWLQTGHLDRPNGTVAVELKPGVKKAQLILSDGQRIEISDLANQAPIIQKGVVIEKKEWALNYNAAELPSGKDTVINYNQLVVGRGEEFQVPLSDGTHVGFNSETRLKYPTHFASNTREVELEGEAYFEVTKNPRAPFIVKTKSLVVEVLGTSLNVSAYEDQKSINTTLVEGKVKVLPLISSLSPAFLGPNEQAEFSHLTQEITVRETDARMATSWINGVFAFEEETLEGIMNKLARWYDISVVFQDERARKSQFSGKLPRFENCNELFEMIEKTTDVNFSIEDDQLVTINFSKN